ncbi:MAG: hypothetical protein JXB26_08190 [Candidatus Aminicenantes bacterium]|nr:hypothetical protein [Candidatus Aminicenantes bacterium]
MKKKIVSVLQIAVIVMGLISLFNFLTPDVQAWRVDYIFGTREDMKNDQGEYIGWRCWHDPCNCVFVIAWLR